MFKIHMWKGLWFSEDRYFPECVDFGMNEIAMVMASYPKSFQRQRTNNTGIFHMIQERQSNMPSQSMGACGNRTKHHYYNESSTNTSLVPLSSPFMNMLNYTTRQVQQTLGQVLIGLIQNAFRQRYDWKHIRTDSVCPYGILTCPRIDMKGNVLESFSNCSHRDTTDCLDVEQGRIVSDYMENSNCPVLLNYFERMYSTFNGVLHKPIMPLPTTCAWKLIEDPAPFSFKHISYFIVSEAGIAWDLSSNVFEGNVEILGGTFMGSLVEHATSSSLWEEEKSGWVTTICPGRASNFLWGSSGGKNWLQFEARTARARARARSQGIASRIPMGGRDRSRNADLNPVVFAHAGLRGKRWRI
jgi:hypothetical protein